MTTVLVTGREGVRLARASAQRTLLVMMPIAVATAVAMISGAAAAGCVVFSFVVLAVARRSPRPLRISQIESWRRAGSGRFAIWAAATTEALLLGWTATLVGAAVVLVPLEVGLGSLEWRPAVVATQLGLLAVAACLPTISLRRPTRGRRAGERAFGIVISLAIALFLVSSAFGGAATIDNDFDLAISGFVILVSLAIATFLISGPAADGATKLLARVPAARASAALCERRRFPTTVRLVVAASVAVVAATAILGASVEARPEADRSFDRALATLPTLPDNVAVVSLQGSLSFPIDVGAFDQASTAVLTPAQQRAVARAVPDAELIPLKHLDAQCIVLCDTPHIVEEPRLRAIFGSARTYPSDDFLPSFTGSTLPATVPAFVRVPPRKEQQRAFVQQGELPSYSFDDVQFAEVPRADAARLGEGRVQTLVVRSPDRLTTTELQRLARVVRGAATPRHIDMRLVGPDGQIAPTPTEPPSFGGTESLRSQPWATTSAAARWGEVLAAAVLALAALLTTLVIDTIDRRGDARRLERMGATPEQIRLASALRTGLLVAVVTWTATILSAFVVRSGVHGYSDRHPESPIPFVMPWPVVLFLTVGLPLLAAGLAALVARPLRGDTVSA